MEHITLAGDLLLAQTNKAIVHAINAETGRTMWVQQIGERKLMNMAPAANERIRGRDQRHEAVYRRSARMAS